MTTITAAATPALFKVIFGQNHQAVFEIIIRVFNELLQLQVFSFIFSFHKISHPDFNRQFYRFVNCQKFLVAARATNRRINYARIF